MLTLPAIFLTVGVGKVLIVMPRKVLRPVHGSAQRGQMPRQARTVNRDFRHIPGSTASSVIVGVYAGEYPINHPTPFAYRLTLPTMLAYKGWRVILRASDRAVRLPLLWSSTATNLHLSVAVGSIAGRTQR